MILVKLPLSILQIKLFCIHSFSIQLDQSSITTTTTKIKRYNTKKGLIEQVFSRLNCSTDSLSLYRKPPADTTICIFKCCVELWMCDSLRFPVWWWMMIKLSLSRLFFASLSKGPFYAHWFWSFVVIVLTPARPSMPTNNNSFFFCGHRKGMTRIHLLMDEIQWE